MSLPQCSKQGLLSGCGAQASHCSGFSCGGAGALGHPGSAVVAPRFQSMAAVVVVPGLSSSAAGGIFLDQGLNLGPPHWQVDFWPLVHHGSLRPAILDGFFWQQTTQNYPSVLKTMNLFLTHIYCYSLSFRDNCRFTYSMAYTGTPHFTYCRMVKIRGKLKCAKLS